MPEQEQKSVILVLNKDLETLISDFKVRISTKGHKNSKEALDETNELISQIEKAQQIDPASLDTPYNL